MKRALLAVVALLSLGLSMPAAARAEGSKPAPTPIPPPRPNPLAYRAHAKTILDGVTIAQCKKAGGPVGAGKVHVTIAASGIVGGAALVTPSAFEGSPVGACIVARYRTAHFPPPPGDAPFELDYAFVLK